MCNMCVYDITYVCNRVLLYCENIQQKGAFVWNEIPRENGKKILDRLKAESYPHFS